MRLEEVESVTHERSAGDRAAAPALAVRGLRGKTVEDVSFDLAPGEILGVAGLLGSGREQLGPLLSGAVVREAGSVVVEGFTVRRGQPKAAIARGLVFVPADRHTLGAVMEMSIRENLTLPRLSTFAGPVAPLRRSPESRDVRGWIEKVDVRPADPERPLHTLSGGNQQKVVLAKWLRTDPRVLVLDEPTQGVDVGAKASIYRLVARAAESGMAVLVVSSDLKELSVLCDRVLVLRAGRVATTVPGAELTPTRLLRETLGWTDTNSTFETQTEGTLDHV